MSHTHKTRFVAAVKKILDSLPSPIDDTGVRELSKFLFGSDKKKLPVVFGKKRINRRVHY